MASKNPARRQRGRPVRFQRSPHIVCYWESGRFLFHNYATGVIVGADPLACQLLDFFASWRTLPALHERFDDYPPSGLDRLVKTLVRRTLLHRSDVAPATNERAMTVFDRWNPYAGLFHSATKNVAYHDRAAGTRVLRQQLDSWAVPSPVKRLTGAAQYRLPAPAREGDFAKVLLARRTWRQFAATQLDVAALGTLLGLTGGVQEWVTTARMGELAFKTSPSGGALHSIEMYVLAQTVAGVPRGLYHYRPDLHLLELVARRARVVDVQRYLPTQSWYQGAAAVVFFSAVFERSAWKYSYARAYRAVLIEAGHLCQTFCLTATSLGLAPFCSMALADRAIEHDLQLDGISESVLYAAGVGMRPDGRERASTPRGQRHLASRPNPRMRGRQAIRTHDRSGK